MAPCERDSRRIIDKLAWLKNFTSALKGPQEPLNAAVRLNSAIKVGAARDQRKYSRGVGVFQIFK